MWWLLIDINLTVLRDTQIAGKTFLVCLRGCFWKILVFTLVDSVKKIPTHQCEQASPKLLSIQIEKR